MAETISQYQVAPFTVPVNGQPGDADQVRGNDNTVRAAINSHDADPGIHMQSWTLAVRPLAGSIGRKGMTSDGLRIYYDNGSSWQEAAYVPLAGPTGTDLALKADATHGLGFYPGNALTWQMLTAGTFQANVDNAVDIGQTSSGRPRSIYAGTSIVAGTIAYGTSGINAPVGYGASTLNFTHLGSGQININTASGAITLSIGGSGFKVIGTALQNSGGTQLVSTSRQTGWTAATGTATRTSFATASVTLPNLAQAVKALIDDLITHGLIGA
jgi:hypothetical protein